MSNIPLHPERGIDPHLCFCPRCGGESNSLAVGHILKAEHEGQTYYANRGQTRKVSQQLGATLHWEQVEEGERIPGAVCDACEKELAMQKQVVNEGGIYFQCKECGQRGVIRACNFTEKVREHMKIAAPEPCGVEFNFCVEHGEEPKDETQH